MRRSAKALAFVGVKASLRQAKATKTNNPTGYLESPSDFFSLGLSHLVSHRFKQYLQPFNPILTYYLFLVYRLTLQAAYFHAVVAKVVVGFV
jgi:hypothetical protein